MLQYCKALLFWLLVNIGWSSDSCSCVFSACVCVYTQTKVRKQVVCGLIIVLCYLHRVLHHHGLPILSGSADGFLIIPICRNNIFSVRLSVPYMSCTLVLECIANWSRYKLDELGLSVYPQSWCFPRPSFAASNNSLNCCSCI